MACDSVYNEVMISAREMQTGNLPTKSQTFINKHFKYTHGYGAVLNRVNEFTKEGLPNLLIKDIPPVSKHKSLEINRPEVYYGELEDEFVIVNSKEIFPGMFKNKEEMPKQIRKHVRYPSDMLLAQGLVYAKYHMTDPTVFYNQEDLWVRATEKYYNNVQPVEPYYIMWQNPGSEEMQFVLILPFTPKNKQVMIGWIAGMCDDENYGRFLAYKFPKEKRIFGTQQVETKIDQDSFLSGQLTLWDQRGSNVIRGNVLAIPINETVIYVEPIYLKSETAAYPELRLVAVMHDDNLSYAQTFDEALKGLFTGEKGKGLKTTMPIEEESMAKLIDNANKAFNDYIQNTQDKKFKEAGEALDQLKKVLNRLTEKTEAE